ncbi:hypothetical protein E8E12_005538 [Didymella heteroderae]|uniref:FAD/NAD(P)-binding domain-containing protein n=1 Tax=Didymella heteroderae TaxID=1769908 RepID=A0A9P5C3E0_9PLEO|nr:hypothetical protein E8E12_005538 [Didymella heteroderae]
MSVAHSYWQLLLTQGLCTGVGAGIFFVPIMGVCATYFAKKKAMALGMVTSGTAMGGVIYPLVVRQLLGKVGFGWTVRVLGLLNVVSLTFCIAFMRPRLPPRKTGPLVDWAAFKDAPYCLQVLGTCCMMPPVYCVFYYVASYARDELGMPYTESLNLVIILNGVGLPARVLPGFIADRFIGVLNVQAIALVFNVVMLWTWLSVNSIAGYYVWVVFYGLGAGAFQSLFPSVIGAYSPDITKTGTRLGMAFTVIGFSALVGGPISGALLQVADGDYTVPICWAASSMMVGTTFTMTHEHELDAVIVGAGFGGIYQLKKLRDAGYKVKLLESGSNYGGVWYWNRYPGARVDSAIPHYEFSDPVLWKNWSWSERFPSSAELRKYFAHVALRWDLRKDTVFDCFVEKAIWDEGEKRWQVTTATSLEYTAKFLLLNTGFAAKRHIPKWEGIDAFKGVFLHPSRWPHEEPDLRGKRIAVIGTGSTGVQLATELAKVAGHLTIFQRTPNMALPMKQDRYDPPVQALPRDQYPDLLAHRKDSFSGFSFNFIPRSTFADTPEQRREVYESLWAQGDFQFWLATYVDMLFDPRANEEAYNFWCRKTRTRIQDERVKEILAPLKPPHAFGCKRISLEKGYFEIFNQENVTLVDASKDGSPILSITATSVKTKKREYEVDVIVCATGYDAVTGGLTQIDIRGRGGLSLKDAWKDGAKTYLGMASHGFPNMFFTYGPQAPTAFCNGPTCAELQGDWIFNIIDHAQEHRLAVAEVLEQAQQEWKELIWKLANASLLSSVDSWYMGTNVPGKPREPLIYLGGVPTYYKTLEEVAEKGYEGFALV